MTDSTGSVDSVGGAGGARDSSAATDAASAQSAAIDAAAESMVEAMTGPMGLDVEALADAVAGVQAQLQDPGIAQQLQTAVEAQLSPVQVGQLQSAIDRAAPTSSLAHTLATSPLAGLAAPAGIYNAQGQLIDECGKVQDTLSVDRSVAARETAYAQAVQHIERIASGPVSGPVYAASYLAGADQQKLDAVHTIGKVFDGALGVQKQRASRPAFEMQPPIPAHWNYTQR